VTVRSVNLLLTGDAKAAYGTAARPLSLICLFAMKAVTRLFALTSNLVMRRVRCSRSHGVYGRNCEVPGTDLYELLQSLHANQNASGVVELFETEHWLHSRFNAAVVLLAMLFRYLQLRIFTGFAKRKLEQFRMPIRRSAAWLGSKPSSVIDRGSPWCVSALRKNALAVATSPVRVRYHFTVLPRSASWCVARSPR